MLQDSIALATEVMFNHMTPRLITFTPSHRQQSLLILHGVSLDKKVDHSNHIHLMRKHTISIFLNIRSKKGGHLIFVIIMVNDLIMEYDRR